MYNETPAEARQLLVDALRSGEYTQCAGTLEKRVAGEVIGNCCLGVACRLFVARYPDRLGVIEAEQYTEFHDCTKGVGGDYYSALLPPSVQEWLGFRTRDGSLRGGESSITLSAANDTGRSFDYIANLIERGAVNVIA